MTIGEFLWVAGANGSGQAGALQITAISGNNVTLLNPVTSAGAGAGGINFTTSEQWTGLTWIDGKKVYQKTINCGTVPVGSSSVSHGIANLSYVNSIVATAALPVAPNVYFAMLPYADPDPTANVTVYADLTVIYFKIGTGQGAFSNVYTTMQYTCTDR
jgi:hypothetical protein